MSEELPLTPIEQSRAATGRVWYVTNPSFYQVMEGLANNYYGRPSHVGSIAPTLASMGDVSQRQVANDGSGRVLVSLEYPDQVLPLFMALLGVVEQSTTAAELTAGYTALLTTLEGDPASAPYVPGLNALLPDLEAIQAATAPAPMATELVASDYASLMPEAEL